MSLKLLSAEQVSEILGVSVQRVWQLTRENQIPFIRIGERQFRYSESALISWLEKGGTKEQAEKSNEGK
ncbi:MAG TPA: helix-turn-helix domain-containing protein [Pyrinomonadaceae bacterium]|nr:helix-turn-helix domain-containing protein [Pyrinomonadaceae bacterium]